MTSAVIVTHQRPGDYADCLNAIWPQVDQVIVVAHDAPYAQPDTGVQVLQWEEALPNISAMWNMGLAAADDGPIAVLNDDAIVPDGWFNSITQAMAHSAAVAGYGGTITQNRRTPDPSHRMNGFAFVVAEGLFADEQFVWWAGDNDLEWRAMEQGGVVEVEGMAVEHRHPDSTTVGALAEIAKHDMDRFVAKWGRRPW